MTTCVLFCYCNYDFFSLLLYYQQVSHSSTFPQSSPTSVRRTTVSPVKGRIVEGRTAVTSRTSGRGRVAATTRSQSAVPCPPRSPQEKPKVTKSQEKDGYAGFCSFFILSFNCLPLLFGNGEVDQHGLCLFYRIRYDSEQ